MERMLVVVFENELKAYDGSRELKALDLKETSIHSEAVIKKNDDGTITIKQEGDDFSNSYGWWNSSRCSDRTSGWSSRIGCGAVGFFAGAVWDMDRAEEF